MDTNSANWHRFFVSSSKRLCSCGEKGLIGKIGKFRKELLKRNWNPTTISLCQKERSLHVDQFKLMFAKFFAISWHKNIPKDILPIP